MPVSRYQLRNEYSLADPELYGAADRDDSEAVLEAVAMAGLVGLLRQLGDLAEFAAGIFHDLHEEVMTTAARGHGLMIRVQQLEADFPSIEKAILSLTNHSHFTYNAGIKWHASLRLDQNLITQGDYPRFIMDSYEECRGPPRLFLLDKFDIAGAGACLKRYSDPSIFKSEFPLSGMKREEVKREKKVRKVKKKGTRWWNEEPLEIFKASDFNAKLNKLASDENNVSDKTPSHGVKLKRRHLNGSSYNSRTGKSYMECILDTHLPKLFPELNEINTQDLTNRFLYKEKNLVQSPNRQDVFKLPMIELGKNVINGGYVKTKHMPIAECKPGEISSSFNQAQNDLLADGISMIKVSANGYGSNEFELEKIPIIVQLEDRKDALVDRGSVAASDADDYRLEDATSELDNYMDALTAMESEMGTDTNIKVKHEPAFCKDIRQVDSNLTDEPQELYAQCLDTYSVKTSSVASHDWSGSLENQESCHSDLETTSSSDLQTSLGNEVGSLDMPENCEVLSPSEQAVLGLTNSNSCLRSAEKLKSYSNGEVASDLYLYQIHDMSSKKLSSNGDILGSKSSETLLSNISGNDVPEAPSHTPELGESPSTSFITGSASTCGHSSLVTSLHEIQPNRLHLAEVFLGSLEINGELPSNPDEIEKQVGDDIPHGAGVSIVSSETNEGVQFIQFAEKFPYGSSGALLQSSDSLDWSRGMKDDDGISKEDFPIEYAEDCSAAEMMRVKTLDCISGDLPVIKTCDLPSRTNYDSILERAPMEYVEDGPGVDNSSSGKVDSLNLMKEEPEILTKEYQDASSGGTLPQTYSTNVQTVKYSLVIENEVLPNENSESSSSAIDCQETDGFQGDFDKMTTGSILLKSLNFYDVGLLESHLEDLGELPNESSGREALSSNSQESTASESEVKDENLREGNHLSSFNVMESSSLHVDLSLLPMEPNFTVEALPVEACSQSDDVGAGCILVGKKLVDCVPEHISPKASGNCNQVQDECFSSERVPDLYGHQSNESSNQGVLIGSQNELNPLVVGSTGLDLVPSTPDSPAASGFLGCAHHPVEIHIHSGNENSEAFIALTESDQESELKSPRHSHCLKSEKGAGLPTSFHFEPAIASEQEAATTSEQAPVVHAVLNQNTASENEEGSSPRCSDLQFETARSLEQMGSSHDFKEGIPPPCDHEVDGWKLTACSPNSSTLAALAPILPALKLPTLKQSSQYHSSNSRTNPFLFFH
ncbi:WH2 domain-containing protein [Cinnamomum micranthum f. kanehirae]|uniref:Protein SCAR n=1 Tax=Cinnamomum micranthum f. kanehirae TaxID=337451 RepID=A0A3S3MCV4_9MAGN|nr:WH2 domain-containing protein [Cinnamomum micranthum f. kanehirae]